MLQPPIHLLTLRSVRRSARTLRHVFALHSRPNNNTPACRLCRGGGGDRSLSLLVALRQPVCVVLLGVILRAVLAATWAVEDCWGASVRWWLVRPRGVGHDARGSRSTGIGLPCNM